MREFKTIDTCAGYRCKVMAGNNTGIGNVAGFTYTPSVYFNYPPGSVPQVVGNDIYIKVNTIKKVIPLCLIVSAFDQIAPITTFHNTYYGWFLQQNNVNRLDSLKILGKTVPYMEQNEASFFWNQVDFNEADFIDVSNLSAAYFNSSVYASMVFNKDPFTVVGPDIWTFTQTFLYLELID
jgi:hypothetical protein